MFVRTACIRGLAPDPNEIRLANPVRNAGLQILSETPTFGGQTPRGSPAPQNRTLNRTVGVSPTGAGRGCPARRLLPLGDPADTLAHARRRGRRRYARTFGEPRGILRRGAKQVEHFMTVLNELATEGAQGRRKVLVRTACIRGLAPNPKGILCASLRPLCGENRKVCSSYS